MTRAFSSNDIKYLRVIPILLLMTCCGQEPSDEYPPPLTPDADLEAIQLEVLSDIQEALHRFERAGIYGVARIEFRGDVVLHEAYGYRDREKNHRMHLEVGFDIGSIVKAITDATVLKLVEIGSLSLSDSVGQFIPDAPEPIQSITVSQLLNHTSGLPEYMGDDYELVGKEEALDRIFNTELRFSPGSDTAYSNAGYTLLAILVEQIAQKPFEQAVRELVLLPAGTPKIGYRLAGWASDRLAVGYVGLVMEMGIGTKGARRWGTSLDHPWLDDGPSWTLRGNGGMLSTTDSLASWYNSLFEGRVLGPEAMERFYALNTGVDPYGVSFGHAGGNDVFNSLHESWPELQVHLTLFTSVSTRTAESAWKYIRYPMRRLAQVAARMDELGN
ncbi:MAG: serine hydrolase domain-containing protein [Myxococcota bacterium]|nr:serine hydrolase domain-containing protein [Myxococcota bacterium]